ncbi:thiamine ABC transporter substrate binding subunit [Halomonas getboli]|uniref:thiamine ABC transporter substrate binding subunit n=1 Tax=Halomonas getboli TaxID=2935862 RepID=UPI001FFEA41B|nr:thiamine ABC transporter substrate binding subunit [Halomonas getboli]MCK2184430.1 thiamine ABC transporter substrate binding subunit [Halomonas getboli]
MAPKVHATGVALATLLVAGVAQAGETLTVYTYDSFVSEWGPGPGIEAAFEARCDCDLEFVALPGGVDILQRLRLEGQDTAADVVLGLDMNLLAEARALDLLTPHGIDTGALDLPIVWNDDTFVPYDWGHFAFVYDTEQLAEPPHSFEALLDAPDDVKVILQDPRTSVTGLGLLLWIKKVYGERAPEIWARLNERVLTVTNGWSQAYFSLFMNGEAPMVLSYATSPAYHMAVEGTDRYQAAEFDDGHYLQVETAARVASSEHPELAREFLAFMLMPDFQRHIPLGNVMHPAVDLGDELPGVYDRLIQPESLTFTPEEVQTHRREWLREWRNAAAR